jgi:hypothetical protein
MKNKMSKIEQVKKHLLKYKQITSWEAIQKYKATRLASIIYDLKEQGIIIKTEMVYKNGINYAIYKIKK